MSNDLVLNMQNQLAELEQQEAVCQRLLQSKHYAKMGAEGVYAIVAKAQSLGVSPIEALNGGLYFVQGKVGMSTEMMASLIRSKGHSIVKDPKSTDECVILHGKRADNGDTWTVSFSLKDAQRAGLLKNMYEKYPSIMLYNRAMSMLARQLWPDIIKGAGYTMEELKEIAVSKNSTSVHDVTVSVSTGELIEVKTPLCTPVQVKLLEDTLKLCDPEYVDKVKSFIKRKPISANSIAELPCEYYDRVFNAAVKNAKEREERENQIAEAQTEPSVFDDSEAPE